MNHQNSEKLLLTKKLSPLTDITQELEVIYKDESKEIFFVNPQVFEPSIDMKLQIVNALQEKADWDEIIKAKVYKRIDGCETETLIIKDEIDK